MKKTTYFRTKLIAAAAAGIGACSSDPVVAPISVRFSDPAAFDAVSPSAVEVKKVPEHRPHTVIAELSIPTEQGASFESLVQRLRERAASLGADAIVEVNSVYDVPAGGPSASSSNTDLSGDAAREAAKSGLSILLHRPRWVSVRAIAIRLLEKHKNDGSYARTEASDSRPSPPQDAERIGIPTTAKPLPVEKAPVDKP
ncbi:MAG: hypothetical protein JNM63_14050 [Spirochaetia bacterium]|nr:hypothetical protein [Spirochaetia bacterium]